MLSEMTLSVWRLSLVLCLVAATGGMAGVRKSGASDLPTVNASLAHLPLDQQHMHRMMMMVAQYGGSDETPIVHAYVEIYGKESTVRGFGEVLVKLNQTKYDPKYNRDGRLKLHPKAKSITPEFAYVTLDERRYFPEETDSLRVWGIKGLPAGPTHWVFVLASGLINAYSHYPGPIPLYFAVGEQVKGELPDSAACFGWEGLSAKLKDVPRAWVEYQDDPLLAVSVFNSAHALERQTGTTADWGTYRMLRAFRRNSTLFKTKEKNHQGHYLMHLADAWNFCTAKKFMEAEAELKSAGELDSTYYSYYWVRGHCLEKSEHKAESLPFYRKAREFAPIDPDVLKKIEKRITELEGDKPTRHAYQSHSKESRRTSKPRIPAPD